MLDASSPGCGHSEIPSPLSSINSHFPSHTLCFSNTLHRMLPRDFMYSLMLAPLWNFPPPQTRLKKPLELSWSVTSLRKPSLSSLHPPGKGKPFFLCSHHTIYTPVSRLGHAFLSVYIAASPTAWQTAWSGARAYSSLFLQHPAQCPTRNSC